jgi:hypothetical protein
MADHEPNRPISVIFADLLSQLAGLARAERRLAHAEMSERIGEAGIGFGLVIAGSVLSIPALTILLQAFVAALASAGLPVGQAGFAVGGAVLVIGLAVLAIGFGRLKVRRLVPEKTIRQLQRDASLASQAMRNDNGIPERAA